MRSDPAEGQSPPGAEGHQPLALRAYLWIKKQILTFQLEPGSMVMAQQLARELGMSPTPVHEALKLLCAERLVQVIPRTGYVISPVTVADVQEMFQLRLVLEPLAADLGLRRASDRDLTAFREDVYRQRFPGDGPPLAAGDPELLHRMSEAHDEFHLAVARLSGQSRLVGIIHDLLDQGRRMFLISAAALPPDPGADPTVPHGAHRRIAEAILARDREAAVEAVADHVRASHRRVVESLARLPAGEGRPRILD